MLDAGKDGSRKRRMHERRYVVKTGGIQERRVQDRRDTEWERYYCTVDRRDKGLLGGRTGGIQDWRESELEGFKTGGIQTGGIQYWRDSIPPFMYPSSPESFLSYSLCYLVPNQGIRTGGIQDWRDSILEGFNPSFHASLQSCIPPVVHPSSHASLK